MGRVGGKLVENLEVGRWGMIKVTFLLFAPLIKFINIFNIVFISCKISQVKKMNKSNPHSSSLKNSYVFSSSGTSANRSFISTSLIKDSGVTDDVRKQRIQNLPNYQKTDLGKDIKMIVVFQTIEIERLSNEVEVLRMKLMETDRQLFNCRNYQVQIKELNEKCCQLEKMRAEHCQQLQKLNKVCKTLSKQNQQLKNRIKEILSQQKQRGQKQKQKKAELVQELQKKRNKQNQNDNMINRLKNDLANQQNRNKQLANAMDRKNTQHNQLKRNYSRIENDNKKIQQMQPVIKQQHNQIQNYIADIGKLENKIQNWEMQLEKQRQISNQLAYKVIVLSCEIQRIFGDGNGEGTSYGINPKECKQLKENYGMLENQVKAKNNQIERLNSRIKTLQDKVRDLTAEFNRLLERAVRNEQETNQLIKKIEQYQDYAKRIHILGAEIDRLKAENRALDEDARRIRTKFADGLAYEQRQETFGIITLLMGVEIESLRTRMNQREISMDEMRKQILEPIRKI